MKQTSNDDVTWKTRSNGDREWIHSGALGAHNTLFLELVDGYIDIHYLIFARNCTFGFLHKLKPMFYLCIHFMRKMWEFWYFPSVKWYRNDRC